MNPANAPKTGTHWADAQGRKVHFYSRNRKAKTVIWHPRFFSWYRTSADARIAKEHWETKHRVLFPEDIAKLRSADKSQEPKPSRTHRHRSPARFHQEELRV